MFWTRSRELTTVTESDSDSSIDHTTNRGNKLKKKSRFVSQGRIGPSLDFAAYKEVGFVVALERNRPSNLSRLDSDLTMPKVAELAGYHRAILHPNPPLIDDEGYDLDSDDNEERVQEALASAREDNPYSSIHLERKCSSMFECLKSGSDAKQIQDSLRL